jgi:hypothetical protein
MKKIFFMSKITQNYFQGKSKRTTMGLSLFVFLLIGTQMSWGQSKQLTGQFLGVDGGFENQAVTGTKLATTTNVADPLVWNSGSGSFAITVISSTPTVDNPTGAPRSGDKGLSCNVTSGTKYIISPLLSPTLADGDYVVQYYFRSPGAVTPSLCQGAIALTPPTPGPNGGVTTYSPAYAADTWIKATRVIVPAVVVPPAVPAAYGVMGATATNFAGIKATGAASPNNLLMTIDDFVVYGGSAVDETAPDAPTGPTLNGLTVGWTAPATGVDLGGYMVVRYATSPNGTNIPNVNGIYAKGNTIANGGKVGTVVYSGTATSFTDDVPGSVSGSDYYKIFTVDKAFNYSTAITASALLKVNSQTFNENKVTVYKNDGVLTINSAGSAINNVKVFDIQGRLLAEQKNVNSNTAVIQNLKATNQILIVKISSEDNLEVIKKVAN